MQQQPFVREIKRKLFHFLSLVYAAGYFYLGKEPVLKILVPILIIVGTVESARLIFPKLNQAILPFFGGIHRESEIKKFSGIFWTLLGCILTIWIFKDRQVVLCALGYLVFADAAAALVGVPLGRHKFFGKSLEGSTACFVASMLVGLVFLHPGWALAAAVLVTAIELAPLPWNDNFWIPTLSGCFLSLKNIIL